MTIDISLSTRHWATYIHRGYKHFDVAFGPFRFAVYWCY